MKKRICTDKPVGDNECMLEQWGRWRMEGTGMPRYVSPLFALMRDSIPSVSGVRQYVITDELALAVDSALA